MSKRMIIILLAIAFLFAGLFVMFSIAKPSHRKQVGTVMAIIPDAISFYEVNERFFDLLLDIQRRIMEFNELEGEDTSGKRTGYSSRFGEFLQEVMITVKDGEVIFDYRKAEYADLITLDEINLIESTLIPLADNYWRGATTITATYIDVFYFSYHRASLYIQSPSEEFEYGDRNTYKQDRYEYAEMINEDWCVYVWKGIYI